MAHLPQAVYVLQRTVSHMKKNNLDNWSNDYPNATVLARDIKRGNLYVAKASNQQYISAIMTLDEEQSAAYAGVNWQRKAGKVLVLHRLAVHPLYLRQGIARKMMKFMENHALTNNYNSIRFDVYSKSLGAIQLYETCGYTRVGKVYFLHKGTTAPYWCYEKLL